MSLLVVRLNFSYGWANCDLHLNFIFISKITSKISKLFFTITTCLFIKMS